jgi:hypothetical protein
MLCVGTADSMIGNVFKQEWVNADERFPQELNAMSFDPKTDG